MIGLGPAGDDDDWMRLADDCIASIASSPSAGAAAAAEGEEAIGFVFATDLFAAEFDAIVAHLRAGTGIADWIGTCGAGVLGGTREYLDQPALVAMATSVPRGALRLLAPGHDEAAARDVAGWAAGHAGCTAIVHGDARDAALPDRLGELADLGDCHVLGGLGSSRVPMVHAAGAIGRGPLSGVVLAPGIVAATGLTQGCSPLGAARRRITKAEGSVIATLDDMPALRALQDDLLALSEPERERAARRLHVALPVAGSDGADYLVRNLTGVDHASGSISIGDLAEPGRELVFVSRDADAAARDLARMAREAMRRCRRPPRAALYYSCIARGANLFGSVSPEVALLRREIGDIPLAGMFCDGEVSNARLYGYTGVLALLA